MKMKNKVFAIRFGQIRNGFGFEPVRTKRWDMQDQVPNYAKRRLPHMLPFENYDCSQNSLNRIVELNPGTKNNGFWQNICALMAADLIMKWDCSKSCNNDQIDYN